MRVAVDGIYFGLLPGLSTEQLLQLSVDSGAEGLNWPFHDKYGAGNPTALAAQIAATGQAVVTLALSSHTSAAPGEEQTFRAHVAAAVEAAGPLGVRVLDAWPRRPEGVSKQDAQDTLRANLEAVVPLLQQSGCLLSLEFEPDHTVERYAEAGAFVAPFAPYVRLTADSYHVVRIGDTLAEAATTLAASLGVLHISGSHRGEPGSEGDSCDYGSFVEAAVAAGYQGDLVLQYQAKGDALDSLKRAVALTRGLIH